MGLETAARINVHKKVRKPKQRVLEIFSPGGDGAAVSTSERQS
jgi:hypothetical protein